jgi:hypothetical protein
VTNGQIDTVLDQVDASVGDRHFHANARVEFKEFMPVGHDIAPPEDGRHADADEPGRCPLPMAGQELQRCIILDRPQGGFIGRLALSRSFAGCARSAAAIACQDAPPGQRPVCWRQIARRDRRAQSARTKRGEHVRIVVEAAFAQCRLGDVPSGVSADQIIVLVCDHILS